MAITETGALIFRIAPARKEPFRRVDQREHRSSPTWWRC
jgi:hypothetical protein